MKKTAIFTAISLCAVLTLSSAVYAEETSTLEGLVAEALSNNRALEAMSYKVDEIEQKVSQSGAWEDPMMNLGIVNDGFEGITVGERAMSRYNIGISQKLPFPGKLSTKEKIAELDTIAARHAYEDLKLKTASGVKMSYHDVYRAQKVKELLEKKKMYLDALEKAALAAYSLGRRGVSDVLVSQTEKYRTIEKIESQQMSMEVSGAKLMQVVGRESSAEVPVLREPQQTPFDRSADELLRQIEESSLLMRSLKAKVEASSAQVELKKLGYYPDVTLGAAYSPRFSDTFDDLWAVSVSFPIPLYYRSKQRASVAEAMSAKGRMEEEYQDQLLKLREEIISGISVIRASDRVLSLYREGLIQKARESMQASIAAYENNKMDIDAVLRTINAAIDYEILFIERMTEREKTIAKLDAITGGLTQ